ncbi:MAG: hypothetical protein V4858_10740 [Pseudomonadota bacterium]
MSVSLEIADGSPWYLSLDVWTVPGDDPEGPQGQPIVGTPCYMWARVHNNGNDLVQNAQVRFYWANPAVGFDRSSANFIGTANVTLAGGAQSDVLCLMPWIPIFVNNGHECVLAEAFHTSLDPLPATLAFNVPTDRHVAQRNLSVVMALKGGLFHMAFEIHNTSRKPGQFKLVTRAATGAELERAIGIFPKVAEALRGAKPGEIANAGFVEDPCPDMQAPGDVRQEVYAQLAAGTRDGLSVVGQLKGDYALLHVEQWAEGRGEKPVLAGGLSVLVVGAVPTPKAAAEAKK